MQQRNVDTPNYRFKPSPSQPSIWCSAHYLECTPVILVISAFPISRWEWERRELPNITCSPISLLSRWKPEANRPHNWCLVGPFLHPRLLPHQWHPFKAQYRLLCSTKKDLFLTYPFQSWITQIHLLHCRHIKAKAYSHWDTSKRDILWLTFFRSLFLCLKSVFRLTVKQ